MEPSGGDAVLGGEEGRGGGEGRRGGGEGESDGRYPTIVKFPTQGGRGVKGVSF